MEISSRGRCFWQPWLDVGFVVGGDTSGEMRETESCDADLSFTQRASRVWCVWYCVILAVNIEEERERESEMLFPLFSRFPLASCQAQTCSPVSILSRLLATSCPVLGTQPDISARIELQFLLIPFFSPTFTICGHTSSTCAYTQFYNEQSFIPICMYSMYVCMYIHRRCGNYDSSMMDLSRSKSKECKAHSHK